MRQRLSQLVLALERVAKASERQADALEKLVTQPSGKLPASEKKRRKHPIKPPAKAEVDEVAVARARRLLKQKGLG